jgi:hypothetical protein
VTTALYEIETSEAADGTSYPTQHLWTPAGEEAEQCGFITHQGLQIAGLEGPYGDPYPVAFVALGHHTWSAVIEASAAYMDRVYGWRTLHLYPGDEPTETIGRLPRAVQAHAVYLHHPHPDHPCGCEWDDTWRLIYAPPTEPGAVPVTVMRHPAAPPTASDIPNPDHDAASAVWAA